MKYGNDRSFAIPEGANAFTARFSRVDAPEVSPAKREAKRAENARRYQSHAQRTAAVLKVQPHSGIATTDTAGRDKTKRISRAAI